MNGGRLHAGVLVPWANTVVEAELHQVSGPSVIWHYARLVPASGTTELDERFLRGLLDAAPAALEQLAALPLSTVYLACTSAGFIYPGAVAVPQGMTITVVSAFEAIIAMLARLSAARIVLLTPYPREITEAEERMFGDHDITVTGSASLGSRDGYGAVTGEQVMKLIPEVSRAAMGEADVVVLSCTGWPTLALIPDLQRGLGKPVLSSNLAIARHAQQTEEIPWQRPWHPG
jgi:maleate isomerase